MNRLLIFVTMLGLSLPVTQAYADSPIFMGTFKSIFSGGSEKSNKAKPVSKKAISLKTKKAKRSANDNASSGGSSVYERFMKATSARDKVLAERTAKRLREVEEKIMLAEQERLNAEQMAANTQKNATSRNNVNKKSTSASTSPSSKRFIIRKDKEPKIDPKKGSFPAPIFKNFR